MSTDAASEILIELPGDPATGMLLLADHASNRVPADIALDPLGRALCAALGCPGVLAAVSRLVIDLNREEHAAGLIPALSDGHVIPGNADLDAAGRGARLARFWRPYHDHLSSRIEATRPKLLISLHSFTPRLQSARDEARPWQVGVLYNQDERAARVAIPLLEAAGIVTGDNLPYSGKLLNATMNRHGEATGTAYLGLEVRQDLIGDAAGVAHWCARLVPVIRATADALA